MPSKSPEAGTPSSAKLASLFSALQVELVGLKSHVAERDALIASLQETVLNLTHENALLKRRIYGNKTERAHTSELQLALGDLLNDERLLQTQLDSAVIQAQGSGGDDNAAPPPEQEKVKAKPKGRRDLSSSAAPRSQSRCSRQANSQLAGREVPVVTPQSPAREPKAISTPQGRAEAFVRDVLAGGDGLEQRLRLVMLGPALYAEVKAIDPSVG